MKEKPPPVDTPPYPIFRKVDSGGTIKKASPLSNSTTLTARRKNHESNSKERTDRITINAGVPGTAPKKPGYKAKMATLKGNDQGTPERNVSQNPGSSKKPEQNQYFGFQKFPNNMFTALAANKDSQKPQEAVLMDYMGRFMNNAHYKKALGSQNHELLNNLKHFVNYLEEKNDQNPD